MLAVLAIGREIVRNNYYVGEHAGTVSILRGVQGSFLGLTLTEPYRLGCLNARNELSLISADQERGDLGCRLMLRPRAWLLARAAEPTPAASPRAGPPPTSGAAPPPPPSPTATALPPPPQEPGTNCRAVP